MIKIPLTLEKMSRINVYNLTLEEIEEYIESLKEVNEDYNKKYEAKLKEKMKKLK